MAQCPNKNRVRADKMGGGEAGCSGRLELVLLVLVTLPLKRLPRGNDGFSEIVSKRFQTSGKRVDGDALNAAYRNGSDIVCDSCGWSLKRAVRAVCDRKPAKR